ncbi:MAG: arylsulfatase [Flavobacteriaceae bacterium]|nr:arylsulfatase [Flavobacteriaceae bacterium]
MKNKYIFISVVCLMFIQSYKSPISLTDKSESKPNIIYILADDLGYGDLSSFNPNGKIKTPHLDELASQGMKFTDAHTSSSVCTPTRYGILTGRYNWRTRLKQGVLNGRSTALIPKERSTVASILKSSGYETAFIGKWHLGWDWPKNEDNHIDFSLPVVNSPNDLGFEYAYGHSGSLDMPPYVYVENTIPTSIPTDTTVNKGKYTWWRKGLTAPDFVHEDVTPNFFRRGMDFIEQQASAKNPFFLYLPLPSPHTPILPSKDWYGKSGLNPYADFIMMIDHYVGQLLSVVENSGIEEDTLIIFTSDNGCSPEADFEELALKGHHPSHHFRGHKADIFEGGHRVPFIAKWPAVIDAGTINDQVICTTDFMATCAEIIGYPLEDDQAEDSFSLFPLFQQKSYNRSAVVHHSINGSFAIRKGDWKLIMCPDSGGWSYPNPRRDKEAIDSLPPIQLYNLKDDVAESENLQAKYPQIVKELQEILTKQILNGRSTKGEVQPNDTGNEWRHLWWI